MLSCAALLLAGTMVVGQTEVKPDGPKEFFSYFDFFAGTWKGTIKTGDETQDCTWSIEATPDKLCHVVFETVDGQHVGQLLYGFEPKQEKWKGVLFATDGSHATILVERPPRPKVKPGDSLRSKSKGSDIDGNPTANASKWNILDQNTVRVHITKRKTGAETQPDITYNMERQ